MKEKVILTENISVKEEKAYSEWKNKSRTYLFFVKKKGNFCSFLLGSSFIIKAKFPPKEQFKNLPRKL